MKLNVAFLTILLNYVSCRDFYIGMFKRNDYLVAQDRLYKERIPYRFTVAKYGRYFKCPITYFRVTDRLGLSRGPRIQITRGGLGHKYVTLRLTSVYNNPISVNIYVGCSPEKATTKRHTPPISSGEEEVKDFGVTDEAPAHAEGPGTTLKAGGGNETAASGGNSTDAAAGGHEATTAASR